MLAVICLNNLISSIISTTTPALHKATHVSGASDGFVSSDLIEAVVKRLRETGGPTDLTIGAIANGEFLQRVGSAIQGGTPTIGASILTNNGGAATLSIGSVSTSCLVLGWCSGGSSDPKLTLNGNNLLAGTGGLVANDLLVVAVLSGGVGTSVSFDLPAGVGRHERLVSTGHSSGTLTLDTQSTGVARTLLVVQ